MLGKFDFGAFAVALGVAVLATFTVMESVGSRTVGPTHPKSYDVYNVRYDDSRFRVLDIRAADMLLVYDRQTRCEILFHNGAAAVLPRPGTSAVLYTELEVMR